MRYDSGNYQVSNSIYKDTSAWSDTSWYTISDDWTGLEIEWKAANSEANNDGYLKLWVDGTLKETIANVDNDTHDIVSVTLGARGIDTGTSGTMFIDDFESRRLSYIGMLPDPGLMPDPEPPDQASWAESIYTYEPSRPHAVTAVDHPSPINDAVYVYDANGNMTCREENGQAWKHTYNDENRLYKVEKIAGTCASPGAASESMTFYYDGDGIRVQQDYNNGSTTVTTLYFAGGMYEIQDSGGAGETTVIYYIFDGQRVGMFDGNDLEYMVTDHQGSVISTISDTATILSVQRYLPFGDVRTDIDTIDETDFGYTGQRDVSEIGLVDYRFRFLSTKLGRFPQPDTIIPNLSNPQNLNRYSYTLNNPLKYMDPTGHSYIRSGPDSEEIHPLDCGGNLCPEPPPTPGGTTPPTHTPTPPPAGLPPSPTSTATPTYSLEDKIADEIEGCPTPPGEFGCEYWDQYPQENPEFAGPSVDDAIIALRHIETALTIVSSFSESQGVALPYNIDDVVSAVATTFESYFDGNGIWNSGVKGGIVFAEELGTGAASVAAGGAASGWAATQCSPGGPLAAGACGLAGFIGGYLVTDYVLGSAFDYVNDKVFFPLVDYTFSN